MFDWTQVLTVPPKTDHTPGHQILHFMSKNKPYWENERSVSFVNTHLANAIQLRSDAEALRFGSDKVELKGLYLELGVCTGKTINFIAALNPYETIYGFDSFEGLPEDWSRGDLQILKGTFGYKNPNNLPPVLHNVQLIKGLFSDTLPKFAKVNTTPIAFLHIDCDLYSSTQCTFEIFDKQIVPGTIIVFDELYNYDNYENHEFKALQEFLTRRNLTAEYLAYNINHEQVVVRIR